jgi:hypothetical protein
MPTKITLSNVAKICTKEVEVEEASIVHGRMFKTMINRS